MIIAAFVSGPMLILTLYIQSWLKEFSDKGDISDERTDFLYQYQGTSGCLCCFFLLGILGRLFDTMSIKISLPITLILRALSWFSLYTIEDPNSWFFFLMIPLTHVMYFATKITAESYITKMYPKDIRGMCNSVYGVCFSLTSFVYLSFCNWLFDKKAKLPFMGCAVADVLIALVVVILVSAGKFGDIIMPEDEQEKE